MRRAPRARHQLLLRALRCAQSRSVSSTPVVSPKLSWCDSHSTPHHAAERPRRLLRASERPAPLRASEDVARHRDAAALELLVVRAGSSGKVVREHRMRDVPDEGRQSEVTRGHQRSSAVISAAVSSDDRAIIAPREDPQIGHQRSSVISDDSGNHRTPGRSTARQAEAGWVRSRNRSSTAQAAS